MKPPVGPDGLLTTPGAAERQAAARRMSRPLRAVLQAALVTIAITFLNRGELHGAGAVVAPLAALAVLTGINWLLEPWMQRFSRRSLERSRRYNPS